MGLKHLTGLHPVNRSVVCCVATLLTETDYITWIECRLDTDIQSWNASPWDNLLDSREVLLEQSFQPINWPWYWQTKQKPMGTNGSGSTSWLPFIYTSINFTSHSVTEAGVLSAAGWAWSLYGKQTRVTGSVQRVGARRLQGVLVLPN